MAPLPCCQAILKNINMLALLEPTCAYATSMINPPIPKYAQDLVVMWAKPNSVTALLSPPPITSEFAKIIAFMEFSTLVSRQ